MQNPQGILADGDQGHAEAGLAGRLQGLDKGRDPGTVDIGNTGKVDEYGAFPSDTVEQNLACLRRTLQVDVSLKGNDDDAAFFFYFMFRFETFFMECL